MHMNTTHHLQLHTGERTGGSAPKETIHTLHGLNDATEPVSCVCAHIVIVTKTCVDIWPVGRKRNVFFGRCERLKRHFLSCVPGNARDRYAIHGSARSAKSASERKKKKQNDLRKYHRHRTGIKQNVYIKLIRNTIGSGRQPTFAFAHQKLRETISFSRNLLRPLIRCHCNSNETACCCFFVHVMRRELDAVVLGPPKIHGRFASVCV